MNQTLTTYEKRKLKYILSKTWVDIDSGRDLAIDKNTITRLMRKLDIEV